MFTTVHLATIVDRTADMLKSVRLIALVSAVVLTGCTAPPARVAPAKPDPAAEPWYAPAVEQLVSLHSEARALLRRGKTDEAAAVITQGQPIIQRVLGVPRPTLAAMEAASDLDQVYGDMLKANRHYGWARLIFQKNFARWKNWSPQTEETIRRRKLAEAAMADCDRHLM